MITLDYKRGEGGKNCPNFDYVICERPLRLIVPYGTAKSYGDRSFSVISPKFFNALPDSVKQSLTVDSFKSSLKTHLFTLSDSDIANIF